MGSEECAWGVARRILLEDMRVAAFVFWLYQILRLDLSCGLVQWCVHSCLAWPLACACFCAIHQDQDGSWRGFYMLLPCQLIR